MAVESLFCYQLTYKAGIAVVLMKGFGDSKERRDRDRSRNVHGSDQMYGNEQPKK